MSDACGCGHAEPAGEDEQAPEHWWQVRELQAAAAAAVFLLAAAALGGIYSLFTQYLQQVQGLSPLAVLGRGYALVRTDDGQLVRSPQQVQAGMGLEVQVADGRFPVTATSRRP